MFYSHEILKKKGKFGTIWLAATVPKRLSKRAIASVDIAKSTKDIIDVITKYSMGEKKDIRFSLYLSSQLMYGLASLNRLQTGSLLNEVQNFASKLSEVRQDTSTIDLKTPVRRFRVTFPEPDFENLPPDFGSFKFNGTPPEFSLEYFIISTPTSEEWQVFPGPPDEFRSPPVEDVGDEHTARHEDITMTEEVDDRLLIIESEEPFPDLPSTVPEDDFSDGLDPSHFLEYIRHETAESLPETEPGLAYNQQSVVHSIDNIAGQEEDTEIQSPTILGTISERDTDLQSQLHPVAPERDLMTPDVSVTVPEPEERDQDTEDDAPERDLMTPDVSVTVPEPEERDQATEDDDTKLPSQKQKKEIHSPLEDADSFALETMLAPTQRRRRRRHLIIDAETTIPRAQIIHNINTANQRLVRPMILPSIEQTAEDLLSNFGLRAAAHGNRRFWRKRRTLPEPNDPSRFGSFQEVFPEASQEMPLLEVTEPDMEEAGRSKSREEPRAEDTRDDTREISAAGTKTSLLSSKLLQDTRDQTTLTGISLPGTSRISLPGTSGISLQDAFGADASGTIISDLRHDMEAEHITEVIGEPGIEFPEVQVPEATEHEAIQDILASQKRKSIGHEMPQDMPRAREKESCVPREEKTPPPPSPELPTSPLINQALIYVQRTFDESPYANLISFKDVLSKTPMTRMYVAKMFNHLLNLHASSIIYVEQPEPDGDIVISKGPNYSDAYE